MKKLLLLIVLLFGHLILFSQEKIIPAQFIGGSDSLYSFITNNIKYPEDAKMNGISAKVNVTFTVDKKGKIKNVYVKKQFFPSLDYEAIRVVKSMPKWIPAKKGDSYISSELTIPISFKIKNK